jgi:hypothetical protein
VDEEQPGLAERVEVDLLLTGASSPGKEPKAVSLSRCSLTRPP